MANKFTLVEEVLDVNADRFWLWIPGFNGYEISTDSYIRSMKHYRKYPFGLLIQPKKDRDGNIIHPEDPIYELSNNNNERVSMRLSQLQYLAKTNDKHIQGYPRRTCITDRGSRNQRCFIKKELKTLPGFNPMSFMPKFNIIKDIEEKDYNPFAQRRFPDITCPIEFDSRGE